MHPYQLISRLSQISSEICAAVTRRSYSRGFQRSIVVSCGALSSEDYVAPEQLLSEPIRRKALEMFESEKRSLGEEYDFGKMF